VRFQGFVGPSYTLQSVNVDCQRCVNLYPEMDEMGTGNEGEVASLVSTPGLKLLVTLPTGPIRGTFCDSTGQLWAVGGNTLYQISSLWVATSIGTLNTSIGPVSFSDNGFEVVIVDGADGYMYTISSGAFTQITDSSFLGADQVDFMDQFLIFNKPNSNQFYLSPLSAVIPFNALDIYTAEAAPENLVGLICLQENLYLLSGKHFEVWYNAGGAVGSTFARIQGAVSEIGCQAAFTIAKMGNAVYWLGQDKNGRGTVYRAQGLQAQRISTQAIETVIQGLGDLSDARAFTYQQEGHSFYCLNLPGASTTWCFDAQTNLWHERAFLSAGSYQRHLADSHAFAYDTNVVGDYSSGNLYALDPGTYTDNGAAIPRERTSPHVGKDLNNIFYSLFQLDMETGVGTTTGQGKAPQVMLQWSNDWGHSWSNEHWTSAGKIGERFVRVIWRRLGRARDRVWRVKITDPIKVTLLGAEMDLEEGVA
jgi:hypothetical protein